MKGARAGREGRCWRSRGRPRASPMAALQLLLCLAVSLFPTRAGSVGLSVRGPSPLCQGSPASHQGHPPGQCLLRDRSHSGGRPQMSGSGVGKMFLSGGCSLISWEQKPLVPCLRASAWLPRLRDRAEEGQPTASEASPAHAHLKLACTVCLGVFVLPCAFCSRATGQALAASSCCRVRVRPFPRPSHSRHRVPRPSIPQGAPAGSLVCSGLSSPRVPLGSQGSSFSTSTAGGMHPCTRRPRSTTPSSSTRSS